MLVVRPQRQQHRQAGDGLFQQSGEEFLYAGEARVVQLVQNHQLLELIEHQQPPPGDRFALQGLAHRLQQRVEFSFLAQLGVMPRRLRIQQLFLEVRQRVVKTADDQRGELSSGDGVS
ncbi:MAG: hypothetical protein ACI93T_003585 [Porticoccaceae bacterium]|jgi:hypothetical protein